MDEHNNNANQQRVVAVSHYDPATKTMYIFGYGEITGFVVPPEYAHGKLSANAHRKRLPVHMATLDNTGVPIWSTEAWLDDETEFDKKREELNATVVTLDIVQRRHAWHQAARTGVDYPQPPQP